MFFHIDAELIVSWPGIWADQYITKTNNYGYH
jgi:hypothetical protein